MPDPAPAKIEDRRQFVETGIRGLLIFLLGAATTALLWRGRSKRLVWQVDSTKCIQCSKCATHCVLEVSAVKCVQAYKVCGYCKLCTAYFDPNPNGLNTGAENQLCPTGAIQRKALEDPYYEYSIDESLCIGCAKCVKGCVMFGNGSFHLQVRHDRCLNCNECSIAVNCPADAFVRLPAEAPYLIKGREAHAG